MSRIVFDRIDTDVLTGTQEVGYLYTLPGNQFSATVTSDKQVTFWMEYGRFTDSPSAYPFSTGIVTVPAGESRGLIVDIAAATQAARLIIKNASGSTAAVVADFGSK